MARSRLYQFLKDNGHSPHEVAERAGLNYGYLVSLLTGARPLTPSAMFKIMKAYPETADFLMPELNRITAPQAQAEQETK